MICNTCGVEKNDDEFFFKDKKKNKRHKACKCCYKISRKKTQYQHYEKNKQQYKDRANNRRKKLGSDNRKLMMEFLKDNHCVDCGNDNPIVLEFDHLHNKQYGISTMMSSYPWEKILVEISKCEVVCANCHKIRTATRAKWYKIQNV